jgi:hypothetical protein
LFHYVAVYSKKLARLANHGSVTLPSTHTRSFN